LRSGLAALRGEAKRSRQAAVNRKQGTAGRRQKSGAGRRLILVMSDKAEQEAVSIEIIKGQTTFP